jgi:peptidoglycan/LPS O-acetylase OafA/YrhL
LTSDLPFASSSARSPTRTEHLHALDGLRGVAALCVLLLHGTELLNLKYQPPSAGLAVDFFFLLSGYVLAFAYDRKLTDHSMSAGRFAILRIVRLYPMLFLGTGLGIAVAMLGHSPASPYLILGSFLLLPVGFISGIPHSQAYPYNNPVWSLFFELIVNFLYGSRLGRSRIRILLGIVVISAIGLVLTSGVLQPGSFLQIGFGSPDLFFAGMFRVSCSFWLGVAVYRLGLARSITPFPLWLAAGVLLLTLLAPMSGILYSLASVLIIFPILVAGTAAAPMSSSSASLCKVSGELSYPLYLLHQPIFRIIKNIPALLHVQIAPLVLLIAGTLASIAIAFASLHLIDIPIRNYLMRLSRIYFSDKLKSRPVYGEEA